MKFLSLLLGSMLLLSAQTNNLTGGLGTNWANVSSSAQTNQMTVPMSTTSGAVFFRLVHP